MNEDINNDDLIVLDDIDDTPDVDIDENEEVVEETPETEQKVEEQTEEKVANETKQETTDETKLLEALKGKVKYNHENVEIKSIDDLVTMYQKGLKFDKLQENIDSAKAFIDERAKRANMSASDYMNKVAEYEAEQEKQKEEKEVQDMINNGVPEATARRVAQVEAYMEKLKAREDEINAKEEAQKAELKKDEEYKRFLDEYPGIKVEEIPKEVFESAKNTDLLSAYRAYENKNLKEKIKQMEQNQKNATTSIVKPASGSTDEQSRDPFEVGFDSEF